MDFSTSAMTNDPKATAIAQRRRLADVLTQQAMTPDANMRSPLSPWGKIAQALAGAGMSYMADRDATKLSDERKTEADAFQSQIATLLQRGSGGDAAPMPAGAPVMAPQSPPSTMAARPAAAPMAPTGEAELTPQNVGLPAPSRASNLTPNQTAPLEPHGRPSASATALALLPHLNSPNPQIRAAAQQAMQVATIQAQEGNRAESRTTADQHRRESRQWQIEDRTAQQDFQRQQADEQRRFQEQQAARPPQPGENERDRALYLQLEEKRAAGTMSPQEQVMHGLLVRKLTGQDQVAVGGAGIAVASPSPLPTLGGGAGGNTIPLSAGAPAGPAPGGAPMAQEPVPTGNVPGADASRAPVPNQRPAVTIQTPGGRTASFMPAEPAAPAGFQRSADGTELAPIPGGPEDQTRQPLTAETAKANMFGRNMDAAHRIIGNVQPPSGAVIAAWRNLPEGVVNMGLNANDQQYFNAVRQFAAGILRKETGAAFSSRELADVQSRFFPLPGDSAEVVRQKTEARTRAIEAMRAEVPGGFRGGQPQGGGGNSRVIEYDAQGRRIAR